MPLRRARAGLPPRRRHARRDPDAPLLRRLLAADPLDARALRLLRARRGGGLHRRRAHRARRRSCRSTPAEAISPRGIPTAGARRSRSSASCAGRRGSARSRTSPSRSGRRRSETRSSMAETPPEPLEIRDFPGAGDPRALLPRAHAPERPVLRRARCTGVLSVQACEALRPRALADRAGVPVLRRAGVRVARAAAAPEPSTAGWATVARYLPEFEPLMPYDVLCVVARRRAAHLRPPRRGRRSPRSAWRSRRSSSDSRAEGACRRSSRPRADSADNVGRRCRIRPR